MNLRRCLKCKGPAHTDISEGVRKLPIGKYIEKRDKMVAEGHRFYPPAEGEPGYEQWFAGTVRTEMAWERKRGD
jgi:hypothetical protein